MNETIPLAAIRMADDETFWHDDDVLGSEVHIRSRLIQYMWTLANDDGT